MPAVVRCKRRARLLRGEPIGFPQKVAPAPDKPIRVWRVLPAG